MDPAVPTLPLNVTVTAGELLPTPQHIQALAITTIVSLALLLMGAFGLARRATTQPHHAMALVAQTLPANAPIAIPFLILLTPPTHLTSPPLPTLPLLTSPRVLIPPLPTTILGADFAGYGETKSRHSATIAIHSPYHQSFHL